MINKIFYIIKPLIPRRVQLLLRRKRALRKLSIYSDVWPIDKRCARLPEGWNGWPNGKRFALILTHDVETQQGHNKCRQLMNLESSLGFCSSFNFVPKRYEVLPELRHHLTDNGFEVGVHGLFHDGKLYKSKKIFEERVSRINHYLKEWGAVGFRSPAMHHNLDWMHNLNIEYDASTFDVDPFEPQPDGVETIFPFHVKSIINGNGYVELPYTLPQDFLLFVIIKEKNIALWKRKLDWIVEQGGMALLNVHPDYMNFDRNKLDIEEYPSGFYKELLVYIKSRYEGQYWNALPKEVAHFMNKL